MPRNLDLPLIGIVAAALVVALVVALVATPVVKNLAIRVKAVDVPKDGRRMHDHPIPRMGGLAIFLGFLLSVLLFLDLNAQMRGMLLGAVIIVVLGIFDDIYSLRAMFKFVVQIIAALVAVLSGNVIETLSNPNVFSADPYWNLGILAVPATVIWIVAITNAVNLIDGLDGLACGVSTISSMTLLVIALVVSEGNVAILMAALAGGCIGFLPYNMNPAKIFMGDTGSTFLGYILAGVHSGPVQVLYHYLLCGSLPHAGPAHLRHLLRLHPPHCPRTEPHARRPQPRAPPAYRHGLQPEAGGGGAVCHQRHPGPVRRCAHHQRAGEGHAAPAGPVLCRGDLRPDFPGRQRKEKRR